MSLKVRQIFPNNMLWRPVGFWDVEDPTLFTHSSHRWRWCCQPYAPAAELWYNNYHAILTCKKRSLATTVYNWRISTLHAKLTLYMEPGQRGRYSNWLRDGRPRGHSSRPGRVKNFLFPTASRPNLGPTLLEVLSPVIKWPERETNHSPPSGAEVNKTWSIQGVSKRALQLLKLIRV
jgi:hypothetical protein